MTRKLPLIFALSLVISFSLFLSVFGEGGFLHNQALRKEIEQLRYADQMLSLQVESLKTQRNLMGGRDALQDAAFKYGYQSEGEQVYYFDLEGKSDALEAPIAAAKPVQGPFFEGLSTLYVFFMALAFATVLTVSYALFECRRR